MTFAVAATIHVGKDRLYAPEAIKKKKRRRKIYLCTRTRFSHSVM